MPSRLDAARVHTGGHAAGGGIFETPESDGNGFVARFLDGEIGKLRFRSWEPVGLSMSRLQI